MCANFRRYAEDSSFGTLSPSPSPDISSGESTTSKNYPDKGDAPPISPKTAHAAVDVKNKRNKARAAHAAAAKKKREKEKEELQKSRKDEKNARDAGDIETANKIREARRKKRKMKKQDDPDYKPSSGESDGSSEEEMMTFGRTPSKSVRRPENVVGSVLRTGEKLLRSWRMSRPMTQSTPTPGQRNSFLDSYMETEPESDSEFYNGDGHAPIARQPAPESSAEEGRPVRNILTVVLVLYLVHIAYLYAFHPERLSPEYIKDNGVVVETEREEVVASPTSVRAGWEALETEHYAPVEWDDEADGYAEAMEYLTNWGEGKGVKVRFDERDVGGEGVEGEGEEGKEEGEEVVV